MTRPVLYSIKRVPLQNQPNENHLQTAEFCELLCSTISKQLHKLMWLIRSIPAFNASLDRYEQVNFQHQTLCHPVGTNGTFNWHNWLLCFQSLFLYLHQNHATFVHEAHQCNKPYILFIWQCSCQSSSFL